MQPIKKQKYFYYIILMLMASTFLPLVFNNLPPLVRSHHLWTVIWGISLLLFNPKIFINKTMVYLFIYGLLLFLATETIWSSIDDWNYKRLFMEFYEIIVGISIITYLFQSKDFITLAKITRWSIAFLLITAIMSLISFSIDPMYARNLTGLAAASEAERESALSLKHYGGGTYSTAGAMMCLFPIFIYYYRNIKLSLVPKIYIIIFSILVFFALLGMQIFGNIIIAVIFCIIALMGLKKIRQSILLIFLLFSVTLIIPRDLYVNTSRSLGSLFSKDSELNYKFRDLALFFETGHHIKNSSSDLDKRIARYPMLMETFTKRPLFGCYFFSDETGNGYNAEGAHLHWMNKLTVTGIVGLVFFLIIPFKFIKDNMKYFSSNYKFYYILASLSILSYGLIKQLGGRDTWYTFFIILPGLYFLPLLKQQQNDNTSV
jgi:hypothetical protein